MSNVADMSLNEMADKAKQTAKDVQEKAKNKFNEFQEKTEDTLRSAGDKAQKQASDINEAVHSYVKDKPLTSLMIAAGVGILLGALISK